MHHFSSFPYILLTYFAIYLDSKMPHVHVSVKLANMPVMTVFLTKMHLLKRNTA